jgi:signal transduction histidine kinase/ligand-binding sensor domain-containing protein
LKITYPSSIAARITLCFLALGLSSEAQTAVAPRMLLRQEALTTWTTEQGLPQDFISSIQQTPDGFLWIGTCSGLARFDGLHFRTFARDAPSALRGCINSLEVDSEGLLWVGTYQGLFVYQHQVFHPVLNHGNTVAGVVQIVRRSRGGVWVRTVSGLLYAVPQAAENYPLPVATQAVEDIAEDASGSLWAVFPDRVLVLRDGRGGGAEIAATYSSPNVKLVYAAPDGRVLISDWHTISVFQNRRFMPISGFGNHTFIRMLLDHKGRIWLASGGPEGIIRGDHGTVERLDKETGLTTDDARVLFEDRDGDLWIGTVAGLQRLHEGTFTSFTERDGLKSSHEQFDAVFEDASGSIWIGSSTDGVAEWNGDRWRVYGHKDGVSQGQVRGFAAGDGKPLISIGGSGIYAWTERKSMGRFERLANVPNDYITSPVRGKDGSLWFSVAKKGVFRRRGDKLTIYGKEDGLTDDTVWCLTVDANGDMWAGASTGVFRFQGEHWSRITNSRPVFGILRVGDGGTFLATAAGLIYNRGSIHWTISEQEGLPSDTVLGVLEDDYGDVWLTTAAGICRIPHRQIELLDRRESSTVSPERFTTADGLRSRSVLPLGQETLVRARDGRLWFATTFAPAVAAPGAGEPPAPHALLDEIAVDDRSLSPTETTVAPGRHRITFRFTAPNFVAPEQTRFRYRLMGWDTQWVDGGLAREASYVGLSPGRYTFEVQALGRTGLPGPVSMGSSIELRPYFWQTRLFLFAMLIAAFALVAEITRRRTSAHAERMNMRFQERASERERIALQIHDTFVQDLVGTALQLELLGLQFDEDPAVARNGLRQLTGRLRGIIARSREIVSNLHSMASTDEDLIDLLHKIEFEFRVAALPTYSVGSEGIPSRLPPFVRDEIYRVCREAVANAFRHADANQVTVSVGFGVGELKVCVSDDGVGMSRDVLRHGKPGHFGLSGMRTHADRIGATLNIQSASGEGTTVSLILLRRKMHRPRQLYSSFKRAFLRERQNTEFEHPFDMN